jgi:hypothetical protein
VTSYFNIKLFRYPEVNISYIEDHDVPILVHAAVDLSSLTGDMSLVHVVLHIDNVSHVRLLASALDIDCSKLKKTLLVLLHHRLVLLSDIFKFSNIYKLVSDQALELLATEEIEEEMLLFSVYPAYTSYLMDYYTHRNVTTVSDHNNSTSAATTTASSNINSSNTGSNTSTSSALSISMLCQSTLQFIMYLHPGRCLADAVLMFVQSGQSQRFFKHVDLVRLLAYLQHKELITRVHEYPIYSPPDSYTGTNANTGTSMFDQMHDNYTNTNLYSSLTLDTLAEHRFTKLTKNKSTINKHTLSHHNANGTSAATGTNNNNSANNSRMYIEEIVRSLDGSEHLDYICCKYEVNHLDIINHPHIRIIYK